MSKVLFTILDWSEVWALFIPLGVLLLRPKQPGYLKPVILYLWLAFFLNVTGDVIADYKKYLPGWLQSNNPLYNIHSLVRFTCFSYFFILLKQPFFIFIKRILPVISLIFVIINFTFIEYFFYDAHLSGDLLAMEAFVLLIYCMLYYLSQLKSEVQGLRASRDFWVVTGLSIYVVINFFVFLFYVPMITENPDLANNMWDVHNVAYILLCLFISKAFYVTPD